MHILCNIRQPYYLVLASLQADALIRARPRSHYRRNPILAGKLGQGSDFLIEREEVKEVPGFYNLAALDAHERNTFEAEGTVGCGDSECAAAVSAADQTVRGTKRALRDAAQNSDMNVRNSSSEGPREFLELRRPLHWAPFPAG